MAIIKLDCNLNGGDAQTPNNELFYRIYGDLDGYVTPIHTTGTAISDETVTVNLDNVIISTVDGGSNTNFKIAAVDEAGNEGVLSDAVSGSVTGIRINTTNASKWAVDVSVNTPVVVELDFILEGNNADYQALMGGNTAGNYYQDMFSNAVDATAVYSPNANTEILIDGAPCTDLIGVSPEMPAGVTKGTLADGNIHTYKATKKTPATGVMTFIGSNDSNVARQLDGIITRISLDGDVYLVNEGVGSTLTSVGGKTITLSSGTAEWVVI